MPENAFQCCGCGSRIKIPYKKVGFRTICSKECESKLLSFGIFTAYDLMPKSHTAILTISSVAQVMDQSLMFCDGDKCLSLPPKG